MHTNPSNVINYQE